MRLVTEGPMPLADVSSPGYVAAAFDLPHITIVRKSASRFGFSRAPRRRWSWFTSFAAGSASQKDGPIMTVASKLDTIAAFAAFRAQPCGGR